MQEGDTGFISSLVPVLGFDSRDGRFSIDVGVGGALLSHHHFGNVAARSSGASFSRNRSRIEYRRVEWF